ncbi:hemoglobin [Geomicrobium halophilum]|uniref:Hemoglobin n=1 Tax=Geomicrobium halophilum TaxID=549000 RepID=A0A841PWT3_9BACL|nr:globin [Geomicrobium halophilum]MBB6448482.1 hemoglobin [Geomicrobium halophilum]
MNEKKRTLYEALGGEQAISTITEQFYQRVHMHPDLKPLFPDDLSETVRKQKQFLTQFCGGSPLYTEEHGHPQLRARHLPFEITPKRAQAWLDCMEKALAASQLEDEEAVHELYRRLTLTAHHMVNTSV